MKQPSYSRCCEDSVVFEDNAFICDICGKELDEKGFPIDEEKDEES